MDKVMIGMMVGFWLGAALCVTLVYAARKAGSKSEKTIETLLRRKAEACERIADALEKERSEL